MAAEREEFIVLQTLDPVETGQEFRSIPPHVTVLSWFAIERSGLEAFIPVFTNLADHFGDEARVGYATERVMYGEKNDTPACLVEVANLPIHFGLRGAVEGLRGVYKYPKFAKNLSTHITDEQGVAVQPGDTIQFSSIVLFSRQDDENGKRKVAEHSIQLGRTHETAA